MTNGFEGYSDETLSIMAQRFFDSVMSWIVSVAIEQVDSSDIPAAAYSFRSVAGMLEGIHKEMESRGIPVNETQKSILKEIIETREELDNEYFNELNSQVNS